MWHTMQRALLYNPLLRQPQGLKFHGALGASQDTRIPVVDTHVANAHATNKKDKGWCLVIQRQRFFFFLSTNELFGFVDAMYARDLGASYRPDSRERFYVAQKPVLLQMG
jgi:hypothetical protein